MTYNRDVSLGLALRLAGLVLGGPDPGLGDSPCHIIRPRPVLDLALGSCSFFVLKQMQQSKKSQLDQYESYMDQMFDCLCASWFSLAEVLPWPWGSRPWPWPWGPGLVTCGLVNITELQCPAAMPHVHTCIHHITHHIPHSYHQPLVVNIPVPDCSPLQLPHFCPQHISFPLFLDAAFIFTLP